MKKTFLTVLVLAAIASCSVNAAGKRQHPHKKVLILGAGLSGIIAGKTLMDNGVDDFLILEGQDYIGGRIKQRPFAGFKIEEGANWIHSYTDEDTKPLWELKEKTHLKGIKSDWEDVIMRDDTGANVTDWASYEFYDKLVTNMESLHEEREKQKKPEISARVALGLMGWRPSTPVKQAIEYFNVDFEFGEKAEEVPYTEIGPEATDYFVTDQRGMITLYRGIYKRFEEKIKLRKAVRKIKYSSTGVEVITKGGHKYTADYAICTFSTGVLASDLVTFSPPLPEWKREAILKMPMVVFTKIFLKFPYKFWDDNEFIMHAARQRGYFPVFMNLANDRIFPGSGLMLMVVTEDIGRRIEMQSFRKTKKEIHKVLKKVYGKKVPAPTHIFYPRWSRNPFVRGSYCDPALGTTEKDMENLGLNLGNLHFGGDATTEWFGFMQGAYISGKKNGEVVSKLVNKSSG